MLERSLLLHAEVYAAGPSRGEHREGGEALTEGDPPVATALGGVWLLGRAAELIARCGDDAAAMWAATANRLVRAWAIELEDLYDAARAPERYLAVAEMRSGGLYALAVGLGGLLAGAGERASAELDEFGRQLGVAAEIRADVGMLSARNGVRAPGADIALGNYPLPLLYVLRDEPGLASRLGKPLGSEELAAVIERVRGSDGLDRATEEWRRRARAAHDALAEGRAPDSLLKIADRLSTPGPDPEP